ncbi:T-complex protein 11 [Geosmithia morbida]|uniref:T-complex protein 11 n=1 Tax=Geosmithia morbida TaxID=1094350 RepID=A0A9P4Z2V2_9HYPO|nr:T-complex protein 11 [Geosmithia morbida]KAF4126414.1 T-complex protein 11 [Geosmithia morbida]
MGPEQQNSGLPMEHSRKNASVSGGDADARQEAESQRQPQQNEDDEMTASQLSPRRCDAAQPALQSVSGPSPTSTPTPTTPAPSKMISGGNGSSSTHHHHHHHHHHRTMSSSGSVPHSARMSLDPPITKSTLSELDLSKIIHNHKLRHDINFNPELHFRPNVEGGKNRRKQQRSDSFWRTLRNQLETFITNPEAFSAQVGDAEGWCLPVLLKTAKEILETLVPQRDRQFLDDGLNVPLLMQQFYKGVLDLEKLAEWLSGVLKSHCAPMRDEEVENMLSLIKTGNQESNLDKLVMGLRELLNVLEHMKLDVANHQIRCWRPILIQDTVHFEQRFLSRKVESGRMTIDASRRWYGRAKIEFGHLPPRGFGDMSVLFEALSRLIQPSSAGTMLPETLQNDHERLMKLRMDMLDTVNLDICMRLYHDLESLSRSVSPSAAAASWLNSNSNGSGSGSGSSSGSDMDDDDSHSSRTLSFNNVSSAPNSRPSSLVLSCCSGSDTSPSPRTSIVVGATPAAPTSVPSYLLATDPAERTNKASSLYASLVDLLYTAAPAADQAERWAAVAPAMAVQIFRYTDAPSDMLPFLEEKLAASLCQVHSEPFLQAQQTLQARLVDQLSARVREFKGLSGLGLFTAVSERRLRPGSQNPRDFYECLREGHDEAAVDDMVTRLAHVGILHWRVWAGLAYE